MAKMIAIGALTIGPATFAVAQPTCAPVQDSKIILSNEVTHGFGNSVSIDGDKAVIGTSNSSAFVFILTKDKWIQQSEPLYGDTTAANLFGESVSISGDTVIIGDPLDKDFGLGSGAAYIFTLVNGVWTRQAKLLATDGAKRDNFGSSVAIYGDTAVVGAIRDDDNGPSSGSVYVFTRVDDQWTQQAKILPNDGDENNRFGGSVSINSDTIIIGAYADGPGSAYVFTRVGTNWIQQSKLLPTNGTGGGRFGYSVSISSDMAIVGAYLADDNGSNSGAAYLFNRENNVWIQHATLLPNDGESFDQFGRSVSIDGNNAIIGSRLSDDFNTNSGSAYVFSCASGQWAQQAIIHAADIPDSGETTGDYFGSFVSLSGDRAIVAAPRDNSDDYSGSSYIFSLNCSNCPADLTGNGTLNFFDISAFLNAFSANDPIADFTNDGIFNFFDISTFLSVFSAGCP